MAFLAFQTHATKNLIFCNKEIKKSWRQKNTNNNFFFLVFKKKILMLILPFLFLFLFFFLLWKRKWQWQWATSLLLSFVVEGYMNIFLKKCPRMRLIWKIIETWRNSGNGKRRATMVPWHPTKHQKHTNEIHGKTIKKEQWVVQRTCSKREKKKLKGRRRKKEGSVKKIEKNKKKMREKKYQKKVAKQNSKVFSFGLDAAHCGNNLP